MSIPSKKLLESIEWHREQLQQAFVQAVNMVYEIDVEDARGEGKYIRPCRHVYQEIARQFNISVWKHGFQGYCSQVIEGLGAQKFRYDGFVFFRGIRRRDECAAKSLELSNQWKREARWGRKVSGDRELGTSATAMRQRKSSLSLIQEWEKKLESEGLPAELKIALGVDGPWKVDNLKKEIAEGRIEKATSAYWRVYRDFCILGLFLQGKAIFPIAEQLKIGRKVVWNRLKFYGLTSVDE